MELECFLWIGHMWKEVMSIFPAKNVKALPSEIVFEILSRLPADEVLKCRRVSKEWRAIVPTPYFSRYHLARASPIVFIQYLIPEISDCGDSVLKLYFLDLGPKKKQMVKDYCSKPTFVMPKRLHRVLFSYNGLIVLETAYFRLESPNFSIYNPITQEEITLKKPFGAGYLCAIYFHSLTREYRLIYTYKTCIGNCWNYVITATGKWIKLETSSFAPPLKCAPVNINGFVYWMIASKLIDYKAAFPPLCSASVITFDTETEEIRVRAHPGKRCDRCQDEQLYMKLLNVENRLVYARIYLNLITMWMLEDSTEWLWAERYNIKLDFNVKQNPYMIGLPCYYIKLIYMQDGQLLIYWDGVGLFQYHLELKTLRKIDIKIKGFRLMSFTWVNLSFISYTKSFEFWGKG